MLGCTRRPLTSQLAYRWVVDRFEQLVLWARLEAPRFKNTKAGRKAQAYMQDSLEGKTDWNAQALKFQLWRYFDGPKPAKAKGGKREEEE